MALMKKVMAASELAAEFAGESGGKCVVFPYGALAIDDVDEFGAVYFESVQSALDWIMGEANRLAYEVRLTIGADHLAVYRFSSGSINVGGANGYNWAMCPQGTFGYPPAEVP